MTPDDAALAIHRSISPLLSATPVNVVVLRKRIADGINAMLQSNAAAGKDPRDALILQLQAKVNTLTTSNNTMQAQMAARETPIRADERAKCVNEALNAPVTVAGGILGTITSTKTQVSVYISTGPH